MKCIGTFFVMFAIVVGVGVLIGSFVDWIGEKKAKDEIKKYYKELARKMHEEDKCKKSK